VIGLCIGHLRFVLFFLFYLFLLLFFVYLFVRWNNQLGRINSAVAIIHFSIMELLARHAVEELNSETQRSGLDALAAVSKKAVPSRSLDASLRMSDSNRMVEKNKVVEEEDDPEFEDDETGSIEYEYCNQDYSNNTHDGAHPKKRRVKSMYKGGTESILF
jgi:hypothetical protein